ncbi:hypothetical protein C8R43DRAFT_1143819, partial [Mycena crocata]
DEHYQNTVTQAAANLENNLLSFDNADTDDANWIDPATQRKRSKSQETGKEEGAEQTKNKKKRNEKEGGEDGIEDVGQKKKRKKKKKKEGAKAKEDLKSSDESGNKSGDGRKSKNGNLLKNWAALTKAEQLAKSAKCSSWLKKALAWELKSGKGGWLGSSRKNLGVYVRTIQECCPEAGSLSYAISQELHRSVQDDNLVCGYHKEKTGIKARVPVGEGGPGAKFQIFGQLLPTIVGKKQDESEGTYHEEDDFVVVVMFDCGCIAAEVILEYWWWKQTPAITREIGGSPSAGPGGTLIRATKGKKVTERKFAATSDMGLHCLDPRHQAYMCQILKDNGITLETIFQNRQTHERYRCRLLQAQYDTFIPRFQSAMRAAGEMPATSVLDLAILPAPKAKGENTLMQNQKTVVLDVGGEHSAGWQEGAEDVSPRALSMMKRDTRAFVEDQRPYVQSVMKGMYSSHEMDETNREVWYVMNRGDPQPKTWSRQWLPEAQQRLDWLETRLDNLTSLARKAKVDILLAKQMILEHKLMACSTREIPAEVLCEILCVAAEEAEGIFWFRLVLKLASVCRAWRDIIGESGKFWMDINFTPGPWGSSLARLLRAKGCPLRVVLDAGKRLERRMLKMLVDASERWGYLELRCPELINTLRVLVDQVPEDDIENWHPWVDGFARLTGRLPRLTDLSIEAKGVRGHWGQLGKSWGTDPLWKSGNVQERDKLRWFEGADQLRTLTVDGVLLPEETLLLPWENLEVYTETRTKGRNMREIPLAHLERMGNLLKLNLDEAQFPYEIREGDTGFRNRGRDVELPKLNTICWVYTRLDYTDDDWFDRLAFLMLPALKHLDLSGTYFKAPEIE